MQYVTAASLLWAYITKWKEGKLIFSSTWPAICTLSHPWGIVPTAATFTLDVAFTFTQKLDILLQAHVVFYPHPAVRLTVLKWNEGCGRGCVKNNQAEKCNFHVRDERICLPAHTRICSQCKAMKIRRKVKASKCFSFWLCSPRSNMANGARCVLSCHSGLEIKWIYKVRTLSWLQAARYMKSQCSSTSCVYMWGFKFWCE